MNKYRKQDTCGIAYSVKNFPQHPALRFIPSNIITLRKWNGQNSSLHKIQEEGRPRVVGRTLDGKLDIQVLVPALPHTFGQTSPLFSSDHRQLWNDQVELADL